MNYFYAQNKIKCEQAPSAAASRPIRRQCLAALRPGLLRECPHHTPGLASPGLLHTASPLHGLLPPPAAPFLVLLYVKCQHGPQIRHRGPCPLWEASLISDPDWWGGSQGTPRKSSILLSQQGLYTIHVIRAHIFTKVEAKFVRQSSFVSLYE